jgi:type II secretory pathway component GspD/PulD (secretin)
MKVLNSFKMVLLMAAISVCLLATPTLQAQSNSNRGNTISISVKETEISELYEMLSRQNKVNILLAEGVEGEVSVNLYNISVKDAIYAIASAAGLAVERIKNGFIITKRSEVGKTIAGGMKDVRTYKIQYTDTKKVAEIIEKHLSQYGNIDTLEDRKMLVIEDLPEFLERIGKLLEQLDQAPAQILIEAKIFSVTLDETQKYGIDWTHTFTTDEGEGNVGVENLGDQLVNLAIGAAAGPSGLFFNYVTDKIEVQLNLLSQKGRLKALSTPSLLALEHQEAEVIIGDRTGYRVTTTINQVTTETIEFLESGVILRVIPHIDRLGRIMMEIHPEVSTTTLNDGIPSLATTEVNTHLLVEDGQTVFIGGLIRNDEFSDHQGVPYLEDIPLLGYLFAKEDNLAISTETIVLIKPQIIRADNISILTSPEEKVNRYSHFREQQSKKVDDYFKDKFLFKKPE